MQWFSGFLKTTLLSFSFYYLCLNKELILMFIIKKSNILLPTNRLCGVWLKLDPMVIDKSKKCEK